MRSGRVAIVGRTNVGKSTFLNAALGQELAIVSAWPQTTRETLLGILTDETSQIAFVDTPGLHAPKSELGRRMNLSALGALSDVNAVLLMTDISGLDSRRAARKEIAVEDRELIQHLPAGVPSFVLINKVDLLKEKSSLLPRMAALTELHPFHAVIPMSALQRSGIDRVLDQIRAALPEGEAPYPADALTDRPVRYLSAEYVREQVLHATRGEVPHAVAVTIDRFEEGPRIHIAATLHVEKSGQRKILIGRGGQMLKRIGIGARTRIEELLEQPVDLRLFVRVTERWKNAPRQLAELGFSPPSPAAAVKKSTP